MTRTQKTTEDINRVLAEKVMGWTLSPGESYWCKFPGAGFSDSVPTSRWNPCANSYQFDKCFERASEELRCSAVYAWIYRVEGTQKADGDWLTSTQLIVKWQLASLEDKCRALAEVMGWE